jgi:hypothetical protein
VDSCRLFGGRVKRPEEALQNSNIDASNVLTRQREAYGHSLSDDVLLVTRVTDAGGCEQPREIRELDFRSS